jgi:hypothetical protein
MDGGPKSSAILIKHERNVSIHDDTVIVVNFQQTMFDKSDGLFAEDVETHPISSLTAGKRERHAVGDIHLRAEGGPEK